MTAAPTPSPSANLFRNYNRLIGLAYAILILALTLFFGYLLDRKMAEEVELIRGHVARHAQFFEFVLRSSADQLEMLRMSATTHGNARSASTAEVLTHPPGTWLREDPSHRGFNLDALPDRDAGGNLIGLGSLQQRTPEFYANLGQALQLNNDWNSLIFTLPNAVQARFLSGHQFHAVLPWQPSPDLPFDPKVYRTPVWTMAQPAANPDRAKFWAPVSFAGKDRGLVAPVAAPLYKGDRLVGVLAIDTSIDYLNRINSDFNYPLGYTLLLDQRRQVLAQPTLYANPLQVTAPPGFAHALPPALAGRLDQLIQLPSGQPTQIEGHLVMRFGLISAPWSVFYVVPESDLWWRLGSHVGASMAGVLLGLALLMGLTYILTSREFVGPAAKLVRHIAAESNFEPATIPVVPTGWRPWFEAVTQAFRESMQLIGLRQELDIAASMQQSILPRHWPRDARYRLWGTMRSAREVGGDFYDHFEAGDGLRGLAVADVSGKGISAGLFGMVSKTLLRSAATRGDQPIGETIANVNDNLAEDNDNCMFVTVFYARLDPESGFLEFVNAGHPSPLLIRPDGEVAWLPLTGGMALGAMEGIRYQASTIPLQPGECLLIYSDGVTEAMNAANEEFGSQRLADLFAGTPPADPREAVERVLAAVDAFADGIEQSDDITCIALQYLGKAPTAAPAVQPPECPT